MFMKLVIVCICLWAVYMAKDLYDSRKNKTEKILLVILYMTALISITIAILRAVI